MLKQSSIKPAKISVALCTYNGAEFLFEQLKSFCKQTRLPDELVIGDDCSSDNTAEIIQQFAETVPFPVHYLMNKCNLGSTRNFEQTIGRCSGDLIFLSDQDDVWLPEKIAAIEIEFNEKPNVGLIFSDADLIDEKSANLRFRLWQFTMTKEERENIEIGKSFETLFRRNVITGATMAFRSSLQQRFMPIPQDIPNALHDWWIAIKCSIYSEIMFIEKPLMNYRQHSNQQIGVDWQRRKLSELPSKLSQKAKQRTAFFEKSIKFSMDEIERIQKTAEILTEELSSEDSTTIEIDALSRLSDKFVAEKRDMIAHNRARRDLPKNRVKRLFPFGVEMATGRYQKYSQGLLSAAKDLIENRK